MTIEKPRIADMFEKYSCSSIIEYDPGETRLGRFIDSVLHNITNPLGPSIKVVCDWETIEGMDIFVLGTHYYGMTPLYSWYLQDDQVIDGRAEFGIISHQQLNSVKELPESSRMARVESNLYYRLKMIAWKSCGATFRSHSLYENRS